MEIFRENRNQIPHMKRALERVSGIPVSLQESQCFRS